MREDGLTVRFYEPSLEQLDRWLEREVALRDAYRPRPLPKPKARRRSRPSSARSCETLCLGCGELFSHVSRGGPKRKYCQRLCASRAWSSDHQEKRRQSFRAYDDRHRARRRAQWKASKRRKRA